MKLLIKPNSNNLKSYIDKRSNAFLFGIFNFSCFSGCALTIDKLKKLINKYPDQEIFIAMDKNIFERELPLLETTLIELSKLPIKGIFFYDMAIYYINKKLDLKLNLIVAQNFLITNYETCNYYDNLGCNGALLTTEITKDEMKVILDNTKIDTYINIYGYQLMAVSKKKLLSNYYKFLGEDKGLKKEDIYNSSNEYIISEDDNGSIILSNYVLNGFDFLNDLKKCSYIILNEYLLDHDDFLKVIDDFYKKISDPRHKMHSKIKTETGFFLKETIYKVK